MPYSIRKGTTILFTVTSFDYVVYTRKLQR